MGQQGTRCECADSRGVGEVSSPKTRNGESQIHGTGVFALEDLQSGETACFLSGRLYEIEEIFGPFVPSTESMRKAQEYCLVDSGVVVCPWLPHTQRFLDEEPPLNGAFVNEATQRHPPNCLFGNCLFLDAFSPELRSSNPEGCSLGFVPLVACRPVEKGEELLVCYNLNSQPADKRGYWPHAACSLPRHPHNPKRMLRLDTETQSDKS